MTTRLPVHRVSPARRLEGELRVPGDKSISHRALFVGAMGRGPMTITGLSPADDVMAALDAIRALGVSAGKSKGQLQDETIYGRGSDFQIVVEGQGREGFRTPAEALDVRNSGTAIRLLLGVLAGSAVEATLTGDMSICRRPMGRVVEPLRRMGAVIDGADGGEHAPLRVRGAPLHGATHELPVPSAQVKSALLLAGLRATGETAISEPRPSRDHTERLFRYLGVPLGGSSGHLIVKSTDISNASVTVPGDLSSAAFLLVAAAILPGSHVVIPGVGVNPTRSGILDIVRMYGAAVDVSEIREECGEPVGTVSVRAGDRRPLDVSGELTLRAIDELPLVGILGAMAEGGVTTVRDAAELRLKETDRIAATAEALRRLGAGIEVLPDGFAVRGAGGLSGATVDPRGDHRIAMAAAVAGLAARGETEVEGWDCVGVSYPGFEEDLERLVVR